MVALVRDVPQAQRILAPLCRMLGVTCAGLRTVRRVRARPVAELAQTAETRDAVPVTVERPGYVPSAKWPRRVISRGSVRLKPA